MRVAATRNSPQYLSQLELADRLGVSVGTIRRMRNLKTTPPDLIVGPSTVRFLLAHVEFWEARDWPDQREFRHLWNIEHPGKRIATAHEVELRAVQFG